MSENGRILVHPLIVVKGIEYIHSGLGRCLQNRFMDKISSNTYLTFEELVDGVAKCLDEIGFFSSKMEEIEELVKEAKDVMPEENISIETFKRDVARAIIEYGEDPEKAYRNTAVEWDDAIAEAELKEDDWWDEDDEEFDEE